MLTELERVQHELARKLTGPAVAKHSMGLAMPEQSRHHINAQKFFTIRRTLGVHGYATYDEALRAIKDVSNDPIKFKAMLLEHLEEMLGV